MNPLIYHNPGCGTSRNTLAMAEASGETPEVIEYLKTPQGRKRLIKLTGMMGVTPRELLRRKETPYDELDLDNPVLTNDQSIDTMVAHPILINRPTVVTDKGARFRPTSERVLDLLDKPVPYFSKEGGEAVHHAEAKQ